MISQVFQTQEVVAREEMIQIGKSGGHPLAKGLIVSASQEGIQPDQLLDLPFQISHFEIEKCSISSIPPVAENEEKGSIGT
jgi:hypothetical protein